MLPKNVEICGADCWGVAFEHACHWFGGKTIKQVCVNIELFQIWGCEEIPLGWNTSWEKTRNHNTVNLMLKWCNKYYLWKNFEKQSPSSRFATWSTPYGSFHQFLSFRWCICSWSNFSLYGGVPQFLCFQLGVVCLMWVGFFFLCCKTRDLSFRNRLRYR